jgi:hypothetical protein
VLNIEVLIAAFLMINDPAAAFAHHPSIDARFACVRNAARRPG